MSYYPPSRPLYGIENEYTCQVTYPNEVVYEIVGECHSVDAKLALYKEPENEGFNNFPDSLITDALLGMDIYRTEAIGMLSNGGRLYIDPSGPEYATPECTTAEEAVLRSFDGDLILLGMLQNLRENGHISGYQLNRRIVDHNRTSRGVHLNVLTHLKHRTPSEIVTNWIAGLNIAKGAIFGSGGLLLEEDGGTNYYHSPRLAVTNSTSAFYGDYRQRPLVRKAFKAEGDKLSRIETVSGDALNFAWPLRASLIATRALISIIEMGYGDTQWRVIHPVISAQKVGKYGSECTIDIVNPKGRTKTVRPLDLIRHVAETAFDIDEKHEFLDPESEQVLNEIIDTADKQSEDIHSVADRVESVARHMAMERKMEQAKVDLGSEKMCRFDYAWDWRGGGIAETLRNKGVVGWHGFKPQVPPSEAKKRLKNPPTDTRAHIRGGVIASENGTYNVHSWDMIAVSSFLTQYVEPFATVAPIPNK